MRLPMMLHSFHSPFDELGPSPVAHEAVLAFQAQLRAGWIAPGLPTSLLEGPSGGKMFGVLVALDECGRSQCLRAFSGMLDGRWDIEGYVPPVFRRSVRDAVEPAGEAIVQDLLRRLQTLSGSDVVLRARQSLTALQARHKEDEKTLKQTLKERRQSRRRQRANGLDSVALAALEQQSRNDKAELRHQKEEHAAQVRDPLRQCQRFDRQRAALERLRHIVCRELMRRIDETYVLPNAAGEQQPLLSLFPQGLPPSGTGDCAAPKLLCAALNRGWKPLALAEFWWGSPPPGGGRVSGVYYPACKDKCGPVLSFMLKGLNVSAPRRFQPARKTGASLNILFEDRSVVILSKPAGVLSVPGKSSAVGDSVLDRLRRRYPDAQGPLLVHRLDLDTSGLLLAALDLETYVALQKQFAARTVKKRYVAWLNGRVETARGTLSLPIRVDVDDRPRQIVDFVHGKSAITEWEVVRTDSDRTRIHLYPRTGRTHQLRVHAAHPQGLNAPILGDRLYGHPAERMYLHAESLAFRHPATAEHLEFQNPAPF